MERSIHLLHGSRLEALAAHMADALAAAPLPGPLDVETIVVPHPGMGRWLQQFLARHWGIAAGLSLDLPGKFIWDAARAVQGDLPPQSGYERDALEWRIHAELTATGGALARAPVLRRYLADGDPLKAFELAQRVADAFDQYMVYRPAWLERWERGAAAFAHPHEPWQRDAWRAVRAAVGEPHRAAVLHEVIAKLEAGTGDAGLAAALPQRVTVFGVSAMPPMHVAFFGALARHVEVRWYQLNPRAE
ncbi:MAG TPA: exodeoxyribonuclease V subunit gamma, partial [Xanthomonadales bacterium]|nr:exodeoxyribonuclease V subunit gamma [Xanthomonadales bacterium]